MTSHRKILGKFPAFALALILTAGCSTAYKAKPLPFRVPSSYANAVEVGGATVAAQAYADPKSAREAFGFDIRGAGMLPVQVIFDNQGPHSLKIIPQQTFLEDDKGNLWPILEEQFAYERATRYSQTKQIFKEGAYAGFLGATAGALIGAAVGIVAGGGVGEALGKGAALGAAAGAALGGAKGYASDESPRRIVNDLNNKSLENRPVKPNNLAYGFIFFPGEAPSAKSLRIQLSELDTGKVYLVQFPL
ncbi:MAG TPA: hypothetical protein VLS90_10855 [Thermodesulfobacteriota bacterium]|nr:hypothetical protein [Thermodesulfobacteriota bacterium]